MPSYRSPPSRLLGFRRVPRGFGVRVGVGVALSHGNEPGVGVGVGIGFGQEPAVGVGVEQHHHDSETLVVVRGCNR